MAYHVSFLLSIGNRDQGEQERGRRGGACDGRVVSVIEGKMRLEQWIP